MRPSGRAPDMLRSVSIEPGFSHHAEGSVLIGRSLRAVTDRKAMGELSIVVDCDVLNADGGTRCAAITGAWVALHLAFDKLVRNRVLPAIPLTGQVAAVSCGLTASGALLDLDYAEDSAAQADANFVLTDSGGIVEIQAAAEQSPFSEAQFHALLDLARHGTTALFAAQRLALGSSADTTPEHNR